MKLIQPKCLILHSYQKGVFHRDIDQINWSCLGTCSWLHLILIDQSNQIDPSNQVKSFPQAQTLFNLPLKIMESKCIKHLAHKNKETLLWHKTSRIGDTQDLNWITLAVYLILQQKSQTWTNVIPLSEFRTKEKVKFLAQLRITFNIDL